MDHVFEYVTSEDRQRLLLEHQHLFPIENRITENGKYIVFSETPRTKDVIYTQVPEERFNSMEETMNFLLLGGL